MDSTRFAAVGSLLVLFAKTPSALAQYPQPVDPRVDRRVDGRVEGRLLDASNYVGGGGYNVESLSSVPNAGNLLITGNVTAGRAFRGYSPIRDTSSLLLSTPSSSLSGFERDSIGLGDVMAGRSQAFASPYFDPSSTARLSGGARLPAPQSTLPSFGQAYAPPRLDSLTGRPLGIDGGFPSPRPLSPGSPAPLGLVDTSARPDPLVADSPLFRSPYASIRRSADAFGTPIVGRPDESAAPSPLGLPAQLDPLDASKPRNLFDTVFGRTDTTLADQRAPSRPEGRDLLLPTRAPSIAAGTPTDAALGRPEPESAPLASGVAPGTESVVESGPPTFVPQGQSIYQDYRAAVRWIEAYEEYRAEYAEKLSALPSTTAEYQESMSFARKLTEESPKSFAGEGDTPVNKRIRQAEDYVRRGEYYHAASQYEVAGALDPRNPLIHLGKGHALLAAGDYLSAVQTLTRGIERFEGIAGFHINLYDFVPDANTLDIRRADLQTKLERRDDYRLRFLLGYIEYYGGLEKFGLPELEKAAAAAPADSVIARFPAMLESPAAQ